MHNCKEINDFIVVLIAHKMGLSDSKNWISFPHNPEVVGSSPSPATISSVLKVSERYCKNTRFLCSKIPKLWLFRMRS